MAEPIGSAFVEVRADLSSLENDANDIQARLRRALAPPDVGEDYRAVAARMRKELGIGVDGAQADTERSFKTAAERSDAALRSIGGPTAFDDVKRESRSAGDAIERNIRTSADQSIGHFGRMGGAGVSVFRSLIGLAAAYGGLRVFEGVIKQASDLNESINAVNVTFGDNAAGIGKLGDQAANNLGLTKNEFNAVAVSFANFGTAIAGPGGDVTKTISDITGRAADFASVMNLDVNTANDLFRSGLSGESEPLRRYGIDISEAAVKSFAYANGIATAGSELDANQKIQARYGLIMSQTNKVQGDFANTSHDLANGMRILRANALETAASFGSAFLPALKDVVGGLNDMVKGLAAPLADLGKAVGGAMKPLLDAIGPVIGIIVKQLSIVVGDVSSMIGSIAPLLSPIVQIIGVVVTALSGGLAAAFKALEPAIKVVADFLNVFAEHLGQGLFDALDAITPLLTLLGELLGNVLAAVLPQIITLFDDLLPLIMQIAAIFTDALLAALPGVADAFIAVANAVIPIIDSGLQIILQAVAEALQAIAPVLPILIQGWIALQAAQLLMNVAAAAFNAIMALNPITLVVIALAALATGLFYAYNHFQTFHDIVDKAWQIMQSVWDFITNFFVAVWHDLQIAVRDVVGVIQDLWDRTASFRGFLEAVFSVVMAAVKLQFELWHGAVSIVWDIIQVLWDRLEPFRAFIADAFITALSLAKLGFNLFHDAMGFVADKTSFLWHTILEPMLSWLGGAFNTGMGAAKKVVEGIRDAFQWVIDKVEWLIHRIEDLINLIPHINLSPLGGSGLADKFAKANNIGPASATVSDIGRITTSPTLSWLSLNRQPEVVVPLGSPGRAVDLMRQSGAGALWDQANSGSKAMVNIESAVFQDATDADLVAQRTVTAVAALRLAS